MPIKPGRFRRFRPPPTPARGGASEPASPSALATLLPRGAGNASESGRIGHAGDATLLDRARERWRLGDWAALASVPASALKHSSDPGRLALMVASAHLQLGQQDEARQFLQRATDWGVDRRLVAQTLIAGLHDTLGRAASLQGDEARAQTHFTAALALASPARVSVSAARARASAQMQALIAPAMPARPDGPAQAPAMPRVRTDDAPAPGQTSALAGRLSVSAGPRRIGRVSERRPWATAVPARDGAWLLAWTSPPSGLTLLALDRTGGQTTERELHLDGAAADAPPELARDGIGHWLLMWACDDGRLRWKRSAEPWDPRPWSAARSLSTGAPVDHLDLMAADGSRTPALVIADAGGVLRGAWRFDEALRDWQVLPLPEGWPDLPMALTLHRDRAGHTRLFGWPCDVAGRPTTSWVAAYDAGSAGWHPARCMASAMPPAGVTPQADAARAIWLHAEWLEDTLLLCDGRGLWWRLDVATMTPEPLPRQDDWADAPVPAVDGQWLVRQRDGQWLPLRLEPASGDGLAFPAPLAGRPLVLMPASPADLLTLTVDGSGDLMLSRLTC